jgi:hypothetical protein
MDLGAIQLAYGTSVVLGTLVVLLRCQFMPEIIQRICMAMILCGYIPKKH